jgi:large subunit ribosomal protein L19e
MQLQEKIFEVLLQPIQSKLNHLHEKKAQKNKRGTTQGSKQGRKGARVGKKTVYVAKVRALRRLLKIAKDRKDLTNPEFWILYKKVGGNTVRNKAHLRTLMEEIKDKRKD